MSKRTRHDLEALAYHAKPNPGKIKVVPTKKYASQRDLSLAYSPGVAAPCLEIQKNPSEAYKYTCLLYTSPSPRDVEESRMPSSA